MEIIEVCDSPRVCIALVRVHTGHNSFNACLTRGIALSM